MKVEKHPKLRAFRIGQLRKRILLPRTKIHASDLDSCPNKVYYRRTCPKIETPERSLLFFLSGICVEYWMAPNYIEPKEKDGIIASPDDLTEWGYGEIKSTRSRKDYFKPATSYPHWIFRMKTYCNIFEVDSWNLEVFFWVGNRGSEPIGYDAWEFKFARNELKEQWEEALMRKGLLEDALEFKYPPSEGWDIAENGWWQKWECGYGSGQCEFKSICPMSNEVDK